MVSITVSAKFSSISIYIYIYIYIIIYIYIYIYIYDTINQLRLCNNCMLRPLRKANAETRRVLNKALKTEAHSPLCKLYIYIGSSNVSFGFLPFSRQLPLSVHIPFSFRVSVHQRTKPYKVEATLSVTCSLSQQSTRAFIGLRRLPDLMGTSPSLVIFLRTCLDCQVNLCTGLDLVF